MDTFRKEGNWTEKEIVGLYKAGLQFRSTMERKSKDTLGRQYYKVDRDKANNGVNNSGVAVLLKKKS